MLTIESIPPWLWKTISLKFPIYSLIFSHDFPVDFSHIFIYGCPHGFPMIFPMIVPWFSYGIPPSSPSTPQPRSPGRSRPPRATHIWAAKILTIAPWRRILWNPIEWSIFPWISILEKHLKSHFMESFSSKKTTIKSRERFHDTPLNDH